MLRRIGSKRKRNKGEVGNRCTMNNFRKYFYGDRIKENEMDEVCSTCVEANKSYAYNICVERCQ
jgi:hypothetical protein